MRHKVKGLGFFIVTRFVLGMVAAGLWIAATVALILLTRRSAAPPARSIRSFRRARRRLAPRRKNATKPLLPPPPPIQPHPLDAIEEIPVMAPDRPPVDAAASPSPFAPPELDYESTNPEMAEIAAVLEAVTDESVVRKRHRVAPPTDRRPPRRPRKVGRITYVLVDDEGRPLD